MKLEREVGGLTCGRVLEHLVDYVEDGLDAVLRQQVETHLRGCDVCERFGGRYAALVAAVRRDLAPPEPLRPNVTERLESRLDAELADLKG